MDEEFIPKADLSRPVVMVRMRPEFFRLMDGNHRVAKARRLGVKELPAYYLTPAQHRQFFKNRAPVVCPPFFGQIELVLLRH
ncbi:hypothetical protein L1279_000583 [Planomicrobium sp. HSC-17F08]|nr:hypothetical protein [Planomicrobium sp. HSC-17F08]